MNRQKSIRRQIGKEGFKAKKETKSKSMKEKGDRA
jgi:hypothetical protein